MFFFGFLIFTLIDFSTGNDTHRHKAKRTIWLWLWLWQYVAYARCQLVANWQRLPCTTGRMRVLVFVIIFFIERQRHEAAALRAQRPQLSLLLNVTYNDMFI